MNNYTPFGQSQVPAQFNPYQQIQQMFPQPQGSVYAINTPTEIGNVPIGSTGLSVAICFPEQIMYIKSFQNGNPIIMAYRVTPYTKEETSAATTQTSTSTAAESPQDNIGQRLDRVEALLKNITENKGGKFDGLI